MKVKMLLVGEPGAGKTHTCVEVSKVIKSVLLDVDDGAGEIIQKLDANVMRYPCLTWKDFASNLRLALKSSADMVIIDSFTELKTVLMWYLKEKIAQKGEFYVGGIERDQPKKVADKDLFVLTWELYPSVYDKLRNVMRAIIAANKSFIATYHPPPSKASKGEVNLYEELVRVTNIVAKIDGDTVSFEKDRFWNLSSLDRDEFIEYIKTIVKAENISETKGFVEGLI